MLKISLKNVLTTLMLVMFVSPLLGVVRLLLSIIEGRQVGRVLGHPAVQLLRDNECKLFHGLLLVRNRTT